MSEQIDNRKQEIFDTANEYRSYFEQEETELDAVAETLLNLQKITMNKINILATAAPGNGTLKYLGEATANAVAIQSQLQSVYKDKRTIKENALNLALKDNAGEVDGDSDDVLATLHELIKEQKRNASNKAEKMESKVLNSADIDAEIEKKLGIN